jgi:hypothetical protein
MQLYRYFVSHSSEFCRHKPLCCFPKSVYYCCCLFRYNSLPKLLYTPSYFLMRIKEQNHGLKSLDTDPPPLISITKFNYMCIHTYICIYILPTLDWTNGLVTLTTTAFKYTLKTIFHFLFLLFATEIYFFFRLVSTLVFVTV